MSRNRMVTTALPGSKSRRRRQNYWWRRYDCGCWHCMTSKQKKNGRSRTTRETVALRDALDGS